MVADRDRPIGMFDSGLGGLTVARAVIDLLPHEDIVYFGDTARNPYGPRPPAEVRGFALEITDLLVDEGVKLVVVACNSAESTAFYEATGRYSVPIVSVIEPGVKAAIAATRNRRIGVIGTAATIASRAYDRAVEGTRANVALFSQACPAFVDFVEAGDTTSEAVMGAAEEYLVPLKREGVDTLILGCTHYPLLSGVIQYVMGEDVVLISSAEATANEVYARLRDERLLKESDVEGAHRFITSGGEEIFGELGRRFLGPEFGTAEHRPWDDHGRNREAS
ncbi:MAG TPA: glutamate racemase [Actinomycetota bacterium]|nr:glutamate racemase [Actinomycetota bacterium]